jgi:C4-dicarboxylate transporter DctM subunit
MAFAIAFANGGVSRAMLAQCLRGTVRITAMIMLVVLGASFLNFALTAAGLGRALQIGLTGWGSTRWGRCW